MYILTRISFEFNLLTTSGNSKYIYIYTVYISDGVPYLLFKLELSFLFRRGAANDYKLKLLGVFKLLKMQIQTSIM